MDESIRYWAENPLWTSALERYYERRDSGIKTLHVDIAALEELLFSAESPAYEFMEAMCSVQRLRAGTDTGVRQGLSLPSCSC